MLDHDEWLALSAVPLKMIPVSLGRFDQIMLLSDVPLSRAPPDDSSGPVTENSAVPETRADEIASNQNVEKMVLLPVAVAPPSLLHWLRLELLAVPPSVPPVGTICTKQIVMFGDIPPSRTPPEDSRELHMKCVATPEAAAPEAAATWNVEKTELVPVPVAVAPDCATCHSVTVAVDVPLTETPAVADVSEGKYARVTEAVPAHKVPPFIKILSA